MAVSDAPVRPLYQHAADYSKPETFDFAYCMECSLSNCIVEETALNHARTTGHRIRIHYTRAYYMRAQ